ncbi:hypothetical protein TYRP_014668 [Tyrophagus putrescentiae]|nr:hypothetical protein TYRP_014668 [Tyrophagus putrescentiae]
MKACKIATCLVIFVLALFKSASGITISRNDNNYDIVLYFNGKQLAANQQLNLPSFQQVSGVVLPTGTRVPPTISIVNGQIQLVPTPRGMVNLMITVQRSNYSNNGSGSGK